MFNNKLTLQEFEKIIIPIIKLDNIELVKESIYSILHFTQANATDKKQYFVNAENTGVNSTYKGFGIEIRRLNDPKNDYTGVTIQFKKKKKLLDILIIPTKQFISDLKKIISTEISEITFSKFDPGGVTSEGVKDAYIYQLSALNPNWNEDDKLSPLIIYIKEDGNSFLIEFTFTPNCYERKLNKTILKGNWLNIYSNTPSW